MNRRGQRCPARRHSRRSVSFASLGIVVSARDVGRLKAVANELPPAAESYLEDDFVMRLLETVFDYQMNTKAVVRELQRYRDQRWDEIRTLDDLLAVLARFPDDQPSNSALAQHLWGYDMWTRAHQLRDLAHYFLSIGVTDQERLQSWAARSREGSAVAAGPSSW